MSTLNEAVDTTYRVKRTFTAPVQKVYDAWTNPRILKEWFRVGNDWTTPVCEVDLRVGGKYRLGMQSPDKDFPFVVQGTYKEIQPPQKLSFTWAWEGQEEDETLVTVYFRAMGDSTELELIHEQFPNKEEQEKHGQGWMGCLEQLQRAL